MKCYSSLLLLLQVAPILATTEEYKKSGDQPEYCVQSQPDINSTSIPRSYGIVLFRGFQTLDVFGPLDALGFLAGQYGLDLHLIAETLDPLTTRPVSPAMNKLNSSAFYEVLPTTTFETAPDFDVLFVPGGIGTRNPMLNSTLDFIKERLSQVQYIISVCTGSLLLSRAGVLDGKRATTNKASYKSVTATNPKVDWVPHARWVVDGNIWTTSGVSSGIDGTLAFIECLYGQEVVTKIANNMEYQRTLDSKDDPFADIWNVTTT